MRFARFVGKTASLVIVQTADCVGYTIRRMLPDASRDGTGQSATSLLAEGARLVKAAIRVLMVRVGLRLLPFKIVLRLCNPRRRPGKKADHYSDAVASEVSAIEQMSHYLARANCLTRALATQRVLRRHGHDARLRLGVRKVGEMTLEAHAWLECAEGMHLGETSIRDAFTPLPPIDGDAPSHE